MPTGLEEAETERRAGGRALWRLKCAQHLAGAVEIQVLMAAGPAADAGHGDIPSTLTGREFYAGAGAADDAARIGVLLALTRRLADQVMLLTARILHGSSSRIMESDGLLVSHREVVEGSGRRVHSITDEGRVTLDQLRRALRELAEEVLE